MQDEQQDPWSVLGVSRNATPKEITAAYRKAALRYHPDRGTEESSNERFAAISHAYETLQQYQQQNEPPSQFHDPFAVFESVFRQEFGNGASPRGRGRGGFFGGGMMDPFQDDFFFSQRPFGRSMFDDDFFSSGFGGSPFGSRQQQRDIDRSARDPFQEMFSSMRQMQEQMMQDQAQGGSNRNSYYSSSTSSTSTMKNGETVTTTERTVFENGTKKTVQETVTRKADGTVDRQVTGDQGLLLDEQQPQQPHKNKKRLLGWFRKPNTNDDDGDNGERNSKL